jgi:hypothetical protein
MGTGSPNNEPMDVMTYNLPQYLPKLNFEDKTFNTFNEQQRIKKYYEKDIQSLDNVFPLNKAGWTSFTTHSHVNPGDVLKQFDKWDRDIVKFLKQRNKDVLTLKYKKNKPPYK